MKWNPRKYILWFLIHPKTNHLSNFLLTLRCIKPQCFPQHNLYLTSYYLRSGSLWLVSTFQREIISFRFRKQRWNRFLWCNSTDLQQELIWPSVPNQQFINCFLCAFPVVIPHFILSLPFCLFHSSAFFPLLHPFAFLFPTFYDFRLLSLYYAFSSFQLMSFLTWHEGRRRDLTNFSPAWLLFLVLDLYSAQFNA